MSVRRSAEKIIITLAAIMCIAARLPSPIQLVRISLAPAMRALIVGGGPDPKHNQVAIESNVRYAYRLLPTGTQTRILFTDGNPNSVNVLTEDTSHNEKYRKPELPRLDGAAELKPLQGELASLSKDVNKTPRTPVLLYFTGHGDPDRPSGYANNKFDLWNEETFTVQDLASAIKPFPKQTPVTLVMVQCFSGAFGNVLFEDGDPTAALADRQFCGFFASLSQRMAAGCTPEVNEANYHDFTGYFFAALTGTDRLDHPVTGADYNHDGKVGMDEAFAYSLIHDDSIDTPVCTSDVFLRRFVKLPESDFMSASYAEVCSWARPAQLAALSGLSTTLSLSGDDRLSRAYERFRNINLSSMESQDVLLIRFVRLARSVMLAHRLEASAEATTKKRFHDLLDLESRNPLKA